MSDKGFTKFKTHHHTDFWKSMNAKNNSKYGTQIAKTWYWYQPWVDEVEKYR